METSVGELSPHPIFSEDDPILSNDHLIIRGESTS
jgi:hypothetical protein